MSELFTQVRVSPFQKEGSKTVGMASVLIADSFWLHKIRIVNGKNGLFVAPPSMKKEQPDGTATYEEFFDSKTAEIRALFSKLILDGYEAKMTNASKPQDVTMLAEMV